MCGLFSFLYKFTRLLLNKVEMKANLKVFISAMMSSFAIFLGEPGDVNLVKTFLYPRAIEGLFNLLVDYRIISPIKYGTQLVSCLSQMFITYSYLIEPHNFVPQSFYTGIHRYSNITQGERNTVAAVYACTQHELKEYYKNSKLPDLNQIQGLILNSGKKVSKQQKS